MKNAEIQEVLNFYVDKYNRPEFIRLDPISIPHQFSKKEDIEIIGFWIAMLSWGNRKTIINKGMELIHLMDNSPYEFIVNSEESDHGRFIRFVQRTFNYTDSLYFLQFFQYWFKEHVSLEEAFLDSDGKYQGNMKMTFEHFNNTFFSLPNYPYRTKKHVSNPSSGSRCKRLIMFLRWMVRKDNNGVDFGIWKKIPMSELLIPLDLHVERMARKLGLLKRKNLDWIAVLELTEACKKFCVEDPSKYDFALFGMSLAEKNGDLDIKLLRNIS